MATEKENPLLKDYAYYLKIERAMSPNTVAAYTKDTAQFLLWLEENTTVRLQDITGSDIEDYLGSRDLSEITGRSQARFLSSLKSFFKWLVMEGWVKENPCDTVEAPKLGRYLPSVLSVEEIDRIMEAVPLDTVYGLRDRAILEVLYGCGLRVSEASDLRISNLYFNEGFIRIIGKGNKERLVPIGEEAITAITNYLNVRPEEKLPKYSDTLFLNRNGAPLSRVFIFRKIKDYALAAGIRTDISPHTFRHSFATHLIENGADLRVVQEMLGHESILTTEIYTHIDKSTWQAAILDHHPRK